MKNQNQPQTLSRFLQALGYQDVTMTPVKSSFIRAIGYDATKKMLFVKFPKGFYSYQGVKSVTVTRWLKAKSKGSFFHQNIRGNYLYRRLDA